MPETPPCNVCGAPSRYLRHGIAVCGPACDRVLGDPEDPIPLVIALLIVAALVGIIVLAVFR